MFVLHGCALCETSKTTGAANGVFACVPGHAHPDPKNVLAIAVDGNTMFALSFTDGGLSPSARSAAALNAALLPAPAAVGGLGSFESPGDSVLEVHALNLQTWTWSKVDAQVLLSLPRTCC